MNRSLIAEVRVRFQSIAWEIFGAFAKLRKATISFIVSASLSVRIEQFGSHWTDFHEIRYQSTIRTPVDKTQVYLKSDKNNGYFT